MHGFGAQARSLGVAAVLGVTTVTSRSAAQVRLWGAQGDTLVIRCPVADCQPRIWLSQPDSSSTLVRIRVDSLEGPEYTLLPLRWNIVGRAERVDTVTLPAGGGVAVALRATLLGRGRYSAALIAEYGKKSMYARIVFLRGQPAQSIELVAPGLVPSTNGTVRLPLQARDSLGRTRRIESVSFDSLTRSSGGRRVQAQFKKVTLGTDATCSHTDSSSLTVRPDAAIQLFVCIDGLDDAGEYAGLLRVKPSDAPAVTRPVTFTVRWDWYCALAAIAFGVGLSIALRRYSQFTKPRLERLAQLQSARARLDAAEAGTPPDDRDATDAARVLRARLAEILDVVDQNPTTNVDARITTLERQTALLGAWRDAMVFVAGIEPAELRAQFAAQLTAARRAVVGQSITADDLTSAEASLVKLPDDVRAKMQELLRTRADEFGKQVMDDLADVADVAVRTELEAVLADNAAALQELSSGNDRGGRDRLNAARLRYVRSIAREQGSMINAKVPPLGVASAKWPGIADSLVDELKAVAATDDPDEAARRLQRAYARHLDIRAEGIARAVQDQQALINASNALNADEKEKLSAMVAQPLPQLRAAQASSVAGRLREAAKTMSAVEKAVIEAIKQVPGPGQKQGGSMTVVPNVAEPVPARDNISALPRMRGELVAPKLGRPGSARRALSLGQWIVLAAAGLVAILVGYNQLYADNATWGGAKDVFTAVLWGLGITQTTGAAFDVAMTSFASKTTTS